MVKAIDRRDFVLWTGAPLLALPARAQDSYPSRTIKIVVPVPPGASTDAIAMGMPTLMSTPWWTATPRRRGLPR